MDEFDHGDTRGISGITNFGTTCYMNAALQALSATKPFLAYMIHPKSELLAHLKQRILDDQFKEYEKACREKQTDIEELDVSLGEIEEEAKAKLAYKLRLMMKRLWYNNCEVKPKQLKQYVDKNLPFFSGASIQHDSQEFLTALIDNIHESTKSSLYEVDENYVESDLEKELLVLDKALITAKKENDNETAKIITDKLNAVYTVEPEKFNEIFARKAWLDMLKTSYSVINDIFSGMTLTILECRTCQKKFHKFERFDILTLNLPEIIEEDKTQYRIEDIFGFYTNTEVIKNTNNNGYYCTFCAEKGEASRTVTIYQNPATLVLLIKKYQKYNGKIIKSNIKIEYDHVLDITPYTTQFKTNPESNPDNLYELYSVIRHSGGYGGGHYFTYVKNAINNKWYLHDDGDVYIVDDDEPLKCNGYIMFYRKINN